MNKRTEEVFKLIEENIKRANKECNGCLSLMYRTITEPKKYIYQQCLFLESGTPDIPNCACKECLLKCICGESCDKFRKKYDIYKRTRKELDSKTCKQITGP